MVLGGITKRDTLDERAYNRAVRTFKDKAKKAIGMDPEKKGDADDDRTLAGSDHGDGKSKGSKNDRSPPLGPDERTPFTGQVKGTSGPAGTDRADGKIEIGEEDCWELCVCLLLVSLTRQARLLVASMEEVVDSLGHLCVVGHCLR